MLPSFRCLESSFGDRHHQTYGALSASVVPNRALALVTLSKRLIQQEMKALPECGEKAQKREEGIFFGKRVSFRR
jgi:hypothetical protein